MIPHQFFSLMVVWALLWLFFMLHVAWPSQGGVTLQRPGEPEPIKPRRTRSKEPPPFVGLTQKPPCALCEHEASHPMPPPPMQPDPMPPTHRRPREVDTSRHFCPHVHCDYRGWRGLHNLRANGHPNGGPWRQLHCTACDSYFPEHHGTIFHGKRVAVELIVRVLACVAEGLGIRATARVFEVDANTVLQWLVEAAEQLRAFSAYFLCELHLEQLQLDELYAVLRAFKAGEISDEEAIKRLERSPYWVWTVMDPTSKLLVVVDVGCRTLAMAQRVVHQVTEVLAPGCVPLFLTDGLKDYGTALLTHFGFWMQPERRQDKGPLPKPRWMPLPELLYAQVVKAYRRRPGSFSFRVWSCTAGGKRVKGFVLRGALLPRHAPHEPKPFLTVGHHDSTASAPYRGFRRDSRLSLLSGQTPSLARHSLAGLLCDVVWLSQL